jgi:hypothetical protein
MKALFDADILVFRCGFAAERNKWFLKVGEGHTQQFDYKKEAETALDEQLPGIMSREMGVDYNLWSERFVEPVEHALHNVRVVVERALESLHLTEWDTTMYLSGSKNFRFDIAKSRPYKGNRDKLHRPTHEAAIKEYIKSKWTTIVSEGEEADDALGIAQCQLGPTESVIITQDKDLDMIPGLKYDFVQDEAYSVTPEQGLYNFHIQLLMGDATDNIPGLPGIGKAKAKAALKGVELDEQMEVVMQMYQAHTPDKLEWFEYLREQGQLLWIRQKPDQMWEPPESTAISADPEEFNLYGTD